MPIADGAVFAGYTIVRLLGTGGMGEVYLAQHPRLPRLEALKILPEDVSADPEFRQRFAREADIAASLWHPHIVAVHDRGEHDGQLWITMDYVEGTDAAQLMRDRYPHGMPPNDALEIVVCHRRCARLRPRALLAASRRETGQHPAHQPAQG